MWKIIGADGTEYGPATLETLRQWLAEGRVNAQTKVAPEGSSDWRFFASVPELAALLPPITVSPLPLPPPPPIPLQSILTTPTPKTNSLALTGLILGILAVTLGWCCCHGLPFSIPGLVCSLVALGQIKDDPIQQQGRGLAIAGLVLCGLSLVAALVLIPVTFMMGLPRTIRHIHRL